MQRTRITLEVDVDLDPVPGNFHTPEQAERAIFGLLHMRIPHYDPTVRVQDERPLEQEDLSFLDPNQRINHLAMKMAMERLPNADQYELARVARKIADGIRRGF